MYGYPSSNNSNFGILFFLFLVFAGMGLLAYHTYSVTVENGDLRQSVSILEARVGELATTEDTLTARNTSLAAENTSLKEANAGLTSENTALRAENTPLKAENADLRTENAGLKMSNVALADENRKLAASIDSQKAALPVTGCDTTNTPPTVALLQSTLVPTSTEGALRLIVGLLLAAILWVWAEMYSLVKAIMKRNTAASRDAAGNGSKSNQSQATHVVDIRTLHL